MPHHLLKLPTSEFRLLRRYYNLVKEQTESAGEPKEPTDGTVVE